MSTITQIPSDQITKGRKLGSGGYSEVYLGNWHGRSVAIKELREADQSQLENEANFLSTLEHENIVKLHGLIADTQHFVFDFIANGSLYDLIKNRSTSNWNKALRLRICKDMTKGLAYLHSQNVIHRDLKSPNILIDDQFNALITDFGLSKLTTHQSTTQTGGLGSIKWMAPEQFESGHYKTSVDIYAIGLVFWEVFEEKELFAEKSVPEIMMAKVMQKQGETPTEKTPENLHKLLNLCWDEAAKRPTAQEILEFFEAFPQEFENKQAMHEAIENGDLEALQQLIEKEIGERAPQVASMVIPQTIDPAIAFGAADWRTYFGDVDVEPPLPFNIEEILDSQCPFWPEKKVKDTHFLCLIPKTVNQKPLTLDSLQELVQKPILGNPTKYIEKWYNYVRTELGSKAVEQSHWVLMTKEVLPNSRVHSLNAENPLIQRVSNYQLPPILEAATVILMHTFKTRGYIFTDDKLGKDWTFTRCLEKVEKNTVQTYVGGQRAEGIYVSRVDQGFQFYGVAGFRKL